jgi:cytochrome c553
MIPLERFRESPPGGLPRAALAVVLLGIASAVSAAPSVTDLRRIEPVHGDAAAGAQKATACLACHGANGVSVAPTFPRLAGQRPGYLYHQLLAFKHADPKDPYYSKSPMPGMAATLSDADMRNLAVYFSTRVPQATDVGAPGAKTDKGETLYRAGDPSHGVPPCQGCHGADANGLDTRAHQYAAYPSLRGQYAPYVIARLTGFRGGQPRDSSNDLVMGGVAQSLDDASIEALAAWISSLTPARSL